MIHYRNWLVAAFRQLALTIPLQVFRPFELLFARLSISRSSNIPPVFIIALPRSGSTLSYQCFSSRFNFNYLTNFSHFFYRLPLIAGFVSTCFVELFGTCSTFRSSKGFVAGFLGPAEGLLFWRYWMNAGLEDEVYSPSLESCSRQDFLFYALYALNSYTSKPFLSAYLGHLFCLPKLHNAFPNAIYIRLHRSPLLNALSLLRCLRDSSCEWFSLYPYECCEYRFSPDAMKVSSQVYWLLRKMEYLSNEVNVFDVDYDEICDNPELVMNNFCSFCKQRGLMLTDRFALPDRFNSRTLDDYLPEDVASVKTCFRLLILRHGPFPSLDLASLV